MLQRIRERAHGWIAWVIFSFIAFTFAIWGVHNYLQNSDDTTIAASIDGRDIRLTEVQQLSEQMRLQSQSQMGPEALANPHFDKLLKQQALESLIRSAVLLKSAEKQGFALDEDQILITLRRIPEFQENGQFSQERFNTLLRHLNLTGEQFYARVYQDMLIEQLQDQFVNSTFVLKSDIEHLAQLMNQRREIDYVILNDSSFLDKMTLTPAEIEKYYRDNAQQFQIPAQVSVEYVTLNMADLQAKATVSEQEIVAYYEANKDSFSEKPKWKLSYILKNVDEKAAPDVVEKVKKQLADLKVQIDKGEDFAKLAQEHSDDVVSKAKGGDLGWVRTGTLDDSFEKVLVDMKTPGQVSSPVRTKYGIVLIKLDGYEPAKVKPLAEIKDAVSKSLQQQKSEKIFAQASETFANLSFEQPNSLQPVADELHLEVKQSGLFDRNGSKEGIAQYPTVVKAAFSDDVLVSGNNSEVLQPTPEMLLVLRLKQQIPARVKPLKDVEAEVIAHLKETQAHKLAEERGKNIVAQLQQKPELLSQMSTLAKDIPLVVKSKTLERLTSDAAASDTDAFQNKVFTMPRPDGSKPTFAGYPLSNGYAIVILKSVTQATLSAEKMKEQEEWLRTVLQRRYAYLVRDLYTQALVHQAKVKMHQHAENLE